MAGAAAKRQSAFPLKTWLTPAWKVHGPSSPSKTRSIPSGDIAVSQAVTDVSYDVQFLMKGAHYRGHRRKSSGGYSGPIRLRKVSFRPAAIHASAVLRRGRENTAERTGHPFAYAALDLERGTARVPGFITSTGVMSSQPYLWCLAVVVPAILTPFAARAFRSAALLPRTHLSDSLIFVESM